MYRVGFPFWKLAARLNVPLLFRVDIQQDKEANVLLATSPDLSGLVVEAKSMDELMQEIHGCAEMLIEVALKQKPKTKPAIAWNGELLPA
jgi:predicted RNase H-like HicB family nuclease